MVLEACNLRFDQSCHFSYRINSLKGREISSSETYFETKFVNHRWWPKYIRRGYRRGTYNYSTWSTRDPRERAHHWNRKSHGVDDGLNFLLKLQERTRHFNSFKIRKVHILVFKNIQILWRKHRHHIVNVPRTRRDLYKL